MIDYTIKEIQDQFRKLGYKWPDFHLIGIRSKDCVPNTFCDTFILYNGGQTFRFVGTTKPGSYYLMHLINPKGAAVLKPGQYLNAWKLGFHRGKKDHLAWVQVRPVTVYRDSDKDELAEVGPTDTGLFGINVHRSSAFSVSKLVDKWSAGCQVFANSKDFAKFVALSVESKQEFFTYTLLEEF